MDRSALALAVAAGLLAALNPCGFALLPAWLGIVVHRSGASGHPAARAMAMSAAMTLGFVAVFAAFGAVIVPLALSVERYLPWATVVIGVALAALGVAMLAGFEPTLRVPGLRRAPNGGWVSMVGYGVAYAVASLSCTVAPFLAVLASTTRADGLPAGLAIVLAYALGMGLLVTVLALTVALAGSVRIDRLRSATGRVNLLSGALLVPAGTYIAWYGYVEIRTLRGDLTPNPVVDQVLEWQGRLARTVDELGPWWLALAAVVIAIGLAVVGRRTRNSRGATVQPK